MSHTDPKDTNPDSENEMADWIEWKQHIINTLQRHETEISGIRELIIKIKQQHYVLWGIFMVAGTILLAGSTAIVTNKVDSLSIHQAGVVTTYTPAGRVDRIRAVWGTSQRNTATGCPTVSELNLLLAPAIRDVTKVERDYVGSLLNKSC